MASKANSGVWTKNTRLGNPTISQFAHPRTGSQNQTIAAITFTQPITPLLQVYQAVQIARADECIAMAKAGIAVAKNAADIEVEEK